MTRTQTVARIYVLLCLMSFWACGHDGGGTPVSPTLQPSATTPAPPAPPSPQPSGSRTIHVGEPASGTITSQDTSCGFTTVDGGWQGLCDAFEITAPDNGVLSVTVRWAGDSSLALFFKTAVGAQIDLACCRPPMVSRMPVEAGTTYRIEVTYVGRPPGYPQVAPVDYTIDATLATDLDAQSSGSVQAIVFGDRARTQRLSNARLQVLDGRKAGTVASFDPTTGFYVFDNLPAGYVQVLVTADGFASLTERLPVGVSVPRELVLERSAPLPDATNSLTGLALASGSPSGAYSAYIGVKVEILDGPLAGVFTFTDEFFGGYSISGLPAGEIHVRASAERLQTQTLGVVISGNTRLDFYMQPK